MFPRWWWAAFARALASVGRWSKIGAPCLDCGALNKWPAGTLCRFCTDGRVAR